MREIRFRAWDLLESNLGMGTVDIHEERRVHIIFESDEAPSHEFKETQIPKWRHNSIGMKHCEVMQFTGLYDKNKVPIFEGDIVARIDRENTIIGEVTFKYGAFGVGDDFLNLWEEDGEVIGNIHENKELLDGN